MGGRRTEGSIPFLLFGMLAILLTPAECQTQPTCGAGNDRLTYTRTEAESFPFTFVTLNTICSDPETLTYAIDVGNVLNHFDINPTTGQLDMKTTPTPDAEELETGEYSSPFVLRISVTDNEMSPMATYVTVIVYITSTNDNTPTYVAKTPYTDLSTFPIINQAEDTALATEIFQCSATDGDNTNYPDQSTIGFGLIGSNPNFLLDPVNCKLWLIDTLPDFDTAPGTVTVPIKALDQGTPVATVSSDLTVTVTDANDNDPVCSRNNFWFSIDDGDSAGSTTVNVGIYCSDADAGTTLSYASSSGDFTVTVLGAVSTTVAVDSEAPTTTLSTEITVTDDGTPQRSTTVTVGFYVSDLDDNIPAAVVATDTATIREDAVIGTSVLTVAATDADVTSENQRLTFTATCDFSWFDVNSQTGELMVSAAMDFATTPTVTCTVSFYSSTISGSTGSTMVTITIIEFNVDPPVFVNQAYTSAAVSENQSPSATVAVTPATIAATDGSSSGMTITYSLPTITSPFSIDSSTGVLTQNGALDYETTQSYLFPVQAVDSGSPVLTTTAFVYILVAPYNDHTPVITAIPDTSIAENTYPGTAILTAVATDADLGVDGDVEYQLNDPNVPFVMERSTGILRVGFNLDREAQASYTITVEAYDLSTATRLTASTAFTMTVTDVNDQSPTCQIVETPTGVQGDIVIDSSKNPGDIVATLTCTDQDTSGPTVTYGKTSGDTDNYFNVDTNSGVIRLAKATPAGTYTFDITVYDGGSSPALDIVIPMKVLVETIITFVTLPTTLSVAENASIGDDLLTVNATGSYDSLTYSIQTDDSGGSFHLNQWSGAFRLLKTVDRETTASYSLTVRASTINGQTQDSTLDITVTDVNDNTPTYPNSYYSWDVSESASTGTTIQQITATDADLGANAVISYSFLSGNGEGKFTYDTSGNLILSVALDYETTHSYSLVLAATDTGSPALTGTTIVYIKVTAVDEVVPTIVQTGGKVLESLAESATVGAALFTIDASDTDLGEELTHTITSGNADNKFFIDANTGDVHVACALDRETTDFYSLGIHVENTLSETATTTLEITVTDVNDNNPVFSKGNYVFTTADSTASGQTIGTLTVTDADLSPNSDYTLSVSSGDPSGRFTFSGDNLQSAEVLLNSDASAYTLTVIAVDGGSPALTSTATVSVVVEAAFTQPTFSATTDSVSHPESIVAGSLLYDCDATSAGSTEGETGDLEYSITSGDTSKFYIEPLDGAIQLLTIFDYDVAASYTLVIRAANRNLLTMTDSLTLTITVQQENLATPVFSNTIYSFTVSEDATVGTDIGTPIVATDADSGAYGTVSYTIATNSDISVDSTTGQLTTAAILEYSSTKSYYLKVYATDNAGVTSKTGTSMVVIDVTDTNNHTPSFTNSPYIIEVPENLAVSTAIRVLCATDDDSGVFGTLIYTITSGNNGTAFAIGSSTGILTLNTQVNYEFLTQYVLLVEANDGGTPSLTGTATVTINVADWNDITPTFSNGARLEARIESSASPLTTVTTLSATDGDTGDAGQVSYLIQSGNTAGYFNIDPTSGVIQTTQSLPAAGGYFLLEIVGVDNGSPPLTGTTTVAVAVQEVTSPGSSDYSFTVGENEVVSTSVGTIPNDPSFTITGYSISAGNYDSGFSISIDPTTSDGLLVTAKVLDRETYAVYQLTVLVTHSTGTFTKSVLVTVTDTNDNVQVFSPNTLVLYMMENTPIGTSIGSFDSITDADTGVNGLITLQVYDPYHINFFTVDSAGVISNVALIDYEGFMTEFVFLVQGNDNGSPRMYGSGTVTVSVLDFTETINTLAIEPAYFMNQVFPYDLATGSEVYTLTVDDFGLTLGSGDTVVFSMATEAGTVFSLDSSTGVMTVNENTLHYFPPSRYLQWVTCAVTSSGTTTSRVGVVRFDTFSRNENMVAVVVASSVADLQTNRATLQTRMSAKFTSPNAARIYSVEATALTTRRRRLLAVESVALTVGIANSSVESLDNIDQAQTFLTQEETLAALQSNADGTPASGLSDATIPVSSVSPYNDGSTSDDTSINDPEIIAVIVVGCVAGVALIVGIIAVTIYCCRTTRLKKYSHVSDPETKPAERNKPPSRKPEPVIYHSNIFDVDDPDVDGGPTRAN